MSRSGLRRKPVEPRTGAKTGSGEGSGYKAFMASYRGLPCAVCNRTWFLKDESGKKILSAGHHLLYRSTHPEYKMTKENIIPLCGKHHVPFAHERPNEFLAWLKEHRPEAWEWREKHNNHRKES